MGGSEQTYIPKLKKESAFQDPFEGHSILGDKEQQKKSVQMDTLLEVDFLNNEWFFPPGTENQPIFLAGYHSSDGIRKVKKDPFITDAKPYLKEIQPILDWYHLSVNDVVLLKGSDIDEDVQDKDTLTVNQFRDELELLQKRGYGKKRIILLSHRRGEYARPWTLFNSRNRMMHPPFLFCKICKDACYANGIFKKNENVEHIYLVTGNVFFDENGLSPDAVIF